MEKKKEENNFSKKQSSILIAVIALFAFLITTGIFLSNNVKDTYSASTGIVTFRGDTDYNLTGSTSHYKDVAPPNGECSIDENGFLDVDCAYKIACICREWSTTKAGTLDNCPYPCQATALYSTNIFTTQFTSGATYYCKGGTSYASQCDIEKPTNKCYECAVTVSSGIGYEYTKAINETRAKINTGSNNCVEKANSYCE